MILKHFNELTSNGWKLVSYKSFLWFAWDARWYWTGRKPYIGPFSTKEAVAIYRFMVETKQDINK